MSSKEKKRKLKAKAVIRLDEEQLNLIDEIAAKNSSTRSKVIRKLIKDSLVNQLIQDSLVKESN